MLTSLILIFSSLAGCLGDDVDADESANEDAYGTVMVSTYHVGELVKAIAGDDVVLEYMSQDNIPVHDYEPSVSDLIRLENSDLFFYHGLGLEPWVESTLSSLGSKAPTSVQVHTMPSGDTTLDYESMLKTDLCDLITEGPYEDVTLVEEGSVLPEIHAKPTAQNISFPEEMHHDEDGHDDHDEDGHDDHDEDGHDDHDAHDHLEAEETENMTDCATEAVLSIFHLEEGQYVLEFEESSLESFNIAILKMGGGHAGHDHGEHDDHDEDGHDDHDEDGHDDHDGHDDDGHDDHDGHDDEVTAEEAMAMADSNNDGNLSWDEFWTMMSQDEDHDDDHDGHDDGNHTDDDHDDGNHTDDDHDDGNHTDDDHDDGNHTDDDHDEEMEFQMNFFMNMFNESDLDSNGLLNMVELRGFIETMDSMEDDDSMGVEYMIMMYDLDGDGELSFDEYKTMFSANEDGHDDHDEDGHDDHDQDGNGMMDDLLQLLFDEMDLDMNGNLSAEELESMFEDEEEHHAAYASLHVRAEGEYGFALPHGVTMHILANGGHDDHGHNDQHGSMVCYNINTHTVDNMLTTEATCEDAGLMWANPDNFVQPGTGDDHDEDGHDEEGHDEDGHDEDNHDEESLNFDPHSWLDPAAFNAQTTVVMDALIAAFPDGEDAFKTNGAAFSAKLVTLDTAYDAAFGTGGLCMTGGHEKKVSANHNAYSYLSVRYDIQFVTVHGLDPEGEPSPQDIAKVVEFIKEDGITVLFVEEYTDPTSVKSIVDETGVSIETLYTMELSPSDPSDDYMSMMESNLANLISGMGC